MTRPNYKTTVFAPKKTFGNPDIVPGPKPASPRFGPTAPIGGDGGSYIKLKTDLDTGGLRVIISKQSSSAAVSLLDVAGVTISSVHELQALHKVVSAAIAIALDAPSVEQPDEHSAAPVKRRRRSSTSLNRAALLPED